MSPALINGYPALANGNSLQYLFTTSSANGVTKQNKQSINGLFQYDSKTGSYYFDSRNNHAQYDAATDTFTLYQQLITSNFIMYPFGNFLPFNDIRTEATYTPAIARGWFVQMRENAAAKYASTKNSEYNDLYTVLNAFITRMDEEGTWDYETLIETYFSTSGITLPGDASSQMSNIYSVDFDEETDFFFGMDMHLEFMQPKGGLTGSDGKQPMVYEFTGDDDVWVYIDGALFLDLSGIHRHVGGKIDFVNGIVYYYKMDPTVGDITNTVVQQYTFRELLKAGGYTDAQIDTLLNDKGTFKDYSEHKLDFYYMERGSGSSVCRMNFNLPLLQKNRISVTKELENNLADALGNPDFMFQVYKSGGKQLLIGEGVTYTVLDANGNVIATKTTGTNGVFTLKAGQTAVFGDILENAGRYFVRELINEDFIKQYGTVSVDGTSVTVNRDVTVGNDTFKGFDSPEKDMSDGSTTFIFTNTVDRLYYGSLEIQKTSNEYTILPENKQFVFALSFDGTPVPAGTKYTLIDADGNETTGTIITAGQLVLFAGQSARFEQILAGTEIFLQEIDSSDYIVTYTATNITLTEDTVNGSVTGRINADQTAQIVVFNDKKGTKLPIVGDKTLLYPNGKDQTYTFILKELVGPDDLTAFLANGTYLESTVTLQDSSIGFTFTLNYPADTASGTRYYLIWEKDADEKAGMDTTKYIVQVAVTSTNGVVSAEIEQIYQNSTATAVDAIAFVNKNVQSLTVHKNVERSDALDRAFRFDLTAILPDGTPISGIFSCEGVDGMTTITLTNGSASFYLKHGESLTIYGLPYGAKWTVTEEKTAGFYTESGTTDTDLSENNAVGGTLTADADAYFVNIGGKELPSTGGYSYYPYLFGGMFLTACSLIIGYVSRRKRERRAL